MDLTMKNEPIHTNGTPPALGETFPEFCLLDTHGNEVCSKDLLGRISVISIVPDITTSVCSTQTRRFTEGVGAMDGVDLYTVSTNEAKEFEEWSKEQDLSLEAITDPKGVLGQKLGLHVEDAGIMARSVFVLDKDNKIIYEQVLEEQTNETAYDPVEEIVKSELNK